MPFAKKEKEKFKKLGHIIAAFIIFVHAYEKYDLHEPSWIFFLLAGVLFLSVALLHHRLVHAFPYIDGVFFVIEAVIYAVIAAEYFELAKKLLPWFYVLASAGYLVAAFVKGRKGETRRRQK